MVETSVPYAKRNRRELQREYLSQKMRYDAFMAQGLQLDMSRGKPGLEQLRISEGMLTAIGGIDACYAVNGVDCRNYGLLDGIPEAKEIFSDLLKIPPEHIIVCGNSSLNIMYDCVARSVMFGVMGSTPWCKLDKVKFLCPVPGYDRHFGITEQFGFEMINIPLLEDGPDMDMVEEYVNNDPAVKGIWCVPLYSNPTGTVYSDEVVKRFANLKPAAEDFRIYWDNAYAIHHLYEEKQGSLLNIIDECAKAGNPDMVYQFCSTSKVTFSGAGIAAMSASPANIADVKSRMKWATIGFDKINQLRHVRFFKDYDGLTEHMKLHANVIRPKFQALLEKLDKELGELGIATWTNPLGGYFISFNAMEGCAKKIVAKCKEAGLVMTGAGAAFPYGNDPQDSNIRIAPTMPSPEELTIAADLFVTCVKLVSVEKLLEA